MPLMWRRPVTAAAVASALTPVACSGTGKILHQTHDRRRAGHLADLRPETCPADEDGAEDSQTSALVQQRPAAFVYPRQGPIEQNSLTAAVTSMIVETLHTLASFFSQGTKQNFLTAVTSMIRENEKPNTNSPQLLFDTVLNIMQKGLTEYQVTEQNLRELSRNFKDTVKSKAVFAEGFKSYTKHLVEKIRVELRRPVLDNVAVHYETIASAEVAAQDGDLLGALQSSFDFINNLKLSIAKAKNIATQDGVNQAPLATGPPAPHSLVDHHLGDEDDKLDEDGDEDDKKQQGLGI